MTERFVENPSENSGTRGWAGLYVGVSHTQLILSSVCDMQRALSSLASACEIFAQTGSHNENRTAG